MMTEAEWLACPRPEILLEYLGGALGDRKMRLFGVACCRRVGQMIGDVRGHRAITASENYADGNATDDALREAQYELEDAILSIGEEVWRSLYKLAYSRAEVACFPDPPTASWATYVATRCAAQICARDQGQGDDWLSHTELQAQADILREIVGNPFRAITVEPSWLAWNCGTAPAIARHVYEDRAFHDLPLLADALEEAGCTEPDILAHCRGTGPHVRGCWVVDLLLGKS
jgi:hypothetical protein